MIQKKVRDVAAPPTRLWVFIRLTMRLNKNLSTNNQQTNVQNLPVDVSA